MAPQPLAAAGVQPSGMMPRVQWHCLPFAQVPPVTLYRMLALRTRVFVVEQACIYQDLDGLDFDAWLVIGTLPVNSSSSKHRAPGPAAGADVASDLDAGADAGADVGAGADVDADVVAKADADAEVVATARVLAPGRRFTEASIGRVCTSPAHRRQGLGRALMDFSIRSARHHHPGSAIRISAQAYLKSFYESFGFKVDSEPYLEDAIPHLEMRLAPDPSAEATDAVRGARDPRPT
ncbi:MAG TPA: GNAT family N-acetyltransferase [Lautropia sp.]|nr:GNAT family N-acetyltransferase [Lautropia sp.]